MIYGLQRKKKDMTRMIREEERKKNPDKNRIRSLVKAQHNCQKQIAEIRLKKKKIKKK